MNVIIYTKFLFSVERKITNDNMTLTRVYQKHVLAYQKHVLFFNQKRIFSFLKSTY